MQLFVKIKIYNFSLYYIFFDTAHSDMGFFREIRSALNEIFAEFSQDVILRSKTFKCIIGENGQQEVELESDGFVPNEIFAVKFKEADWKDEAYPAIGELLLYSGGTFRIHWISAR